MTVPPRTGADHLTTTYETVREREYDYIVLGGGGTAAAFIDGVRARRPSARILVLEQGPYLLPDHVQNLGLAYQPLMARATATPWRSDGDLAIVSQVPFLGGRTLVWSGCVPRPTPDQLSSWPAAITDGLREQWKAAQAWLGAAPASTLGPEFGGMHRRIRATVADALPRDPRLLAKDADLLDAPLAHPNDGSGGRSKFSAIVPLVRATAAGAGVDIVTECFVERLERAGGTVTTIRTARGPLSTNAATVVLALGTSEATGLVLRSRRTLAAPLAGQNLSGNAASFFTCRVPRSPFGPLRDVGPELSALYIDGRTADREYHLHVSAMATTDLLRDRERIFRLMPDMFGDNTPDLASDDGHVVLVVHGLAEVAGARGDGQRSRIELDGDTTVGHFALDRSDRAAWDAMDDAADLVVAALAGRDGAEYWSPVSRMWNRRAPDRRMPFAFHETGTLRMGDDPDRAATDVDGRLNGTTNVYVLGGAAFPTQGSWNPFLTMVALAFRLSEHLESRREGAP